MRSRNETGGGVGEEGERKNMRMPYVRTCRQYHLCHSRRQSEEMLYPK